MTAKHKCSERIFTGYHWRSCYRPATVQHSDKWFCWQHHPEREEADAEKACAARQARIDRGAVKYARIARNARLAALVTPELAMLLEDVVSGETANYDRMQREPARKLAAQIREEGIR